MRSFLLRLSFVAMCSLSTLACGTSSDSTSGIAESDLTKTGIAASKVDLHKQSFGLRGHVLDDRIENKKQGEIVGYRLTPSAGEYVKASVSIYGNDGTAYLLEDTGATNYKVIDKKALTSSWMEGAPAEFSFEYTNGKYIVAVSVGAAVKKSLSQTVTLTVRGYAAGIDHAWADDLLQAIDDNVIVPADEPSFDPKNLKGDAKAEYDDLARTWGAGFAPYVTTIGFQDKTVIFLENDHEGGGSLSVYTDNFEFIAGGSYGESSPFVWD